MLNLEKEINSSVIFKIKTTDNMINKFYHDKINIEDQSGKNIRIYTTIDIPYIAEGPVPDSKKDYVEMSKVFNIYIVISEKNKSITEKREFEVFDAYGALGFFILDIRSFDEFISKNNVSNDIIEALTTTEIATEIFNKGLMILSWGHTPWIYYINSFKGDDIENYLGEHTEYCGYYKLKKSKSYSVIPGNELQDWNTCKNKKWPSIKISGEGNYVRIQLYLKYALSQSDSDYPIPTFYLERCTEKPDIIEPLLQTNIFKI